MTTNDLGIIKAASGSQEIDARRNDQMIDSILELALDEDLGPGMIDVTSQATIDPTEVSSARLVLKESAVVCGVNIFQTVAKRLALNYDTSGHSTFDLRIQEVINEGTFVSVPPDTAPVTVATLAGNARCLLAAERLSLNLVQRMCGVATLTQKYCQTAESAGVQILDTRKTMPGLRALDRRAVRAGGGTNHRFGLFDAILIKDNHVRASGGVGAAVKKARDYLSSVNPTLANRVIEVEVTTLEELHEALAEAADRVLLDNMAPSLVRLAIEAIKESGRVCFVEVSGGVNLDNLESYLIPGVNAISIGALTHSAKNVDLSLEFD